MTFIFCQMGVYNRDIKLENTLLDSSRRPLLKICDFGYSKHENDSLPISRVGTPGYTGKLLRGKLQNIRLRAHSKETRPRRSCLIQFGRNSRLGLLSRRQRGRPCEPFTSKLSLQSFIRFLLQFFPEINQLCKQKTSCGKW